MKPIIKKLPDSQVLVEAKIGRTDFKVYWESAYERARLQVEVKGFRPGSAPKEMVDPLINKEKVFQSAAENAIRESLQEVTEANKWQVINKPEIDVDEKEMDLTYRATLTLFPEVKLGDYKKIAKRINNELAKTLVELSVGEAELNKSLEWLRESRAKEGLVSRSIEKEDLVQLDVQISVEKKFFPEADLKRERLLVGRAAFLPGFDEKLIGRKAGEEFSVTLTAPQNFWQKDLAGKVVEGRVKIHAVFERQLPELNDDFAKSLGPSFKNLEDLKTQVRAGVREEKKMRESEKARIKIVDELARDSKADLPKVMVERTLDGLVREFETFAKQSGRTVTDLRGELLSRAQDDVLKNLVIYEVVKKENLYPAAAELDVEKAKRGARPDGVDEASYDDYIYGVILNQKAFAFLASIN